jgi:predicted naringenin-chalcone synthase
MTLSSYVPHLLSTNIKPVVEAALAQNNYSLADVTHWCIHPGGKRILEAIGKQLDIDDGQMKEAYSVLGSHGNMSSATILFVLKKMMYQIKETRDSALVFGVAFGPGLTMETFLAESV